MKLNRRTRAAVIGYSFLLPNIIGFLIFMAGPVFYSLVLSFFRYDIFSPLLFIDLDNYIYLFLDKNSHFWEFLYNTVFFIFAVPLTMGFSLILAILVNRKMKGITIFRTIYFLPVVASMITIALIWEFILDKDFGLMNSFLNLLGFSKIDWFGDAFNAKIGISLMLIWKSAGYNMLIYLAALQGIPNQLYEAARIDGAGWWHRFRSVTLPMLAPAHLFLLVTGMISTFQLFGPIYVMTEGGPVTGTWTLIFEMYWKGYQEFEMGYAASVSWVLFLLMLSIALIHWRWLRKKGFY